MRASMTSGLARPENAEESAFSSPETLSTRTPSQPSDSARSGMSTRSTAVAVSGYPTAAWCSSILFRLPSENTTSTSPRPSRAATASSVAVMPNPPSPVRHTTGPGPDTAAPIAAGSPNPIAHSPLVISVSLRAYAVPACPAVILCDPTSVVTTVPAGAAERTVVTTSDGFSRPGAYPACHASRSAARCAATADQRGSPPQGPASHGSAAATFPTPSVAAGY